MLTSMTSARGRVEPQSPATHSKRGWACLPPGLREAPSAPYEAGTLLSVTEGYFYSHMLAEHLLLQLTLHSPPARSGLPLFRQTKVDGHIFNARFVFSIQIQGH